MQDPEIAAALLQVTILLLPLWVTLGLFIVREVPIKGDRYGIISGSIMTIILLIIWEINDEMINILNALPGTIGSDEPTRGGIRILLELYYLTIAIWFLFLVIIYLKSRERLVEDLNNLISESDLETNELKFDRWWVVTFASIILWLGGIIFVTFVLAIFGRSFVG